MPWGLPLRAPQLDYSPITRGPLRSGRDRGDALVLIASKKVAAGYDVVLWRRLARRDSNCKAKILIHRQFLSFLRYEGHIEGETGRCLLSQLFPGSNRLRDDVSAGRAAELAPKLGYLCCGEFDESC